MLETFVTLVRDCIAWRRQLLALALIELRKQTSNSLLGIGWLILKPVIYILCFWFALFIGLKSRDMESGQFLVWLAAGVIPWMFLSSAIQHGSGLFNSYKHLVSKLEFPPELISVFYELASLIVHFMLLAVFTVVYIIVGGRITVQFLQLPILFVLMFVFAVGFSLMTSPLTAMSRDVQYLIKSLSTPIFWLSGVIFSVSDVSSSAVQLALKFDPVTFLIESYRIIYCNGSIVGDSAGWIWDDPVFFGCGVGVILLTFIAGLFVYSKLKNTVSDAL